MRVRREVLSFLQDRNGRLRATASGRSRAALALASALAVSMSAQAEETSVRLEEITVTAQKIEQRLEDVPMSITAFGSEMLEDLRVTRLQDVLTITPGVDFETSGPMYSNVHIRGINTSVGGVFQTVAVTLDDAPLIATFNGFILASRLFDVERVEVLRGPQGTLTGSNSTSGSINVITKKPQLGQFFGELTVDYGRFNTQLLKGSVNLPLGETLSLRTAAFTERSDGAVENVGPAGGNSGYDNYGGRVALRFAPNERILIDTAFNYEQQRAGLRDDVTYFIAGYDDPANADQFWAQWLTERIGRLQAAGGDLNNSPFINSGRNGPNGARVRKDSPEFSDQTIWSTTLNGGYEADSHQFNLLYTHLDYSGESSFDGDASEWAIERWNQSFEPKSNYGELRVTSRYDGPVNWIAGVSYMKERRVERSSFIAGDDAPFFWQGDPTIPSPGGRYNPNEWFAVLEGIESKALFANVFWDITERLHLSAGARGTRSESFTAYGGEGGANRDFTPDFSATTYGKTDEFDPRIAFNFDLTDEVTTYVQYATGFRPGYGNTAFERAAAAGIAIPKVVGGEKLTNYEVGLKGSFFDERMSIALAAYYMDYDDMQVSVTTEPVLIDGVLQQIEYDNNSAAASARGFELEASGFPTDSLLLSAGLSHAEGTIDAVYEDEEVYRDVDFPRIRAWNANASLQYTRRVMSTADAKLRLDYSYHSEADTFPWKGEGPAGVLPEHQLVDLSLAIEQGAWKAQAYLENVCNERYWNSIDMFSSPYGTLVGIVPRRFGIRFTRTFGQ